VQPLPEAWTPDNMLFSSIWSYTPPMLDPAQQTATSSTTTISLPSTPSTGSSLVLGSPNYMQHYTIPASAIDDEDSIPTLASPFRTPSDKRRKIPRPPNAFMLFRSWLIKDGKLPPEVERRQQNISKIAGKAWRLLDESSKDGWRTEAFRRLQDHERNYPGYKFDPSPKNYRTGLEKIRKAVGGSNDDTARRLKALSDVYAKDHRAVNLSTPQRPRRQRASPYKFPSTDRTPQRPARGYKTPQLIPGSQLGSPSMSSLITFDSPSPSPAQSLSPLPFHTQPHALAQGMAQQPLPYMFLPPGLPSHFQQAYRQEDGVCISAIPRSADSKLTRSFQTIIFADNYAPVNPFAPLPGYYTFNQAGPVPQVVNTSGTMTGTASDTTTAMLGLYELNHPYAHFNPNLDPGFPSYQPPVQSSPVPPATNQLSAPLSTAPLTPHEQEVFNAIIGNSQMPLTLENLIPLPFSFPEDPFVTAGGSVADFPSPASPSSPSPLSTSTPPQELSFTKSQTSKNESPVPATPQPPVTDQYV